MDTKAKMAEFLDEQIIGDLDLVEKVIFESFESEVELLKDISSYLVRAGGKRVRPAFVLLSFRAVGGEEIQKVVPIAAAIEMIHTATIIHDDINDNCMIRRGMPSVNQKFGLPKALVAGDFLFAKAFRIGGSYDWEIVKIIADACANLAEGEILQSTNRYNVELTLNDYKNTIAKKTASLISACGAVGAILGDAPKNKVDALWSYGHNIGMTFQVIDDILDLEGSKEETGKPRGTDIREGQLSVPLIRAFSALEPKKREELSVIINKHDNNEEDIERAITLINETDAISFSRDMAEEFGTKARDALDILSDSDYRDNLELLIDAVIERNY
jgi:geranylgeranyl pyrophosphate synthase